MRKLLRILILTHHLRDERRTVALAEQKMHVAGPGDTAEHDELLEDAKKPRTRRTDCKSIAAAINK